MYFLGMVSAALRGSSNDPRLAPASSPPHSAPSASTESDARPSTAALSVDANVDADNAAGITVSAAPHDQASAGTLDDFVDKHQLQTLSERSRDVMAQLMTDWNPSEAEALLDQFEDHGKSVGAYKDKINLLLSNASNANGLAAASTAAKDTVYKIVDGLGCLADTHPILKYAWFLVSAGYKIAQGVEQAAEFDALSTRFLDGSTEIHRLMALQSKTIPIETSQLLSKSIKSFISCLIDVASAYLDYFKAGQSVALGPFGGTSKTLADLNERLDAANANLCRVKQDGTLDVLVAVAGDVVEIEKDGKANTAKLVKAVTAQDSNTAQVRVFSRAVLQHSVETLIVGPGVRVNELQWVEPQATTNVGSVTVDALIAGNAAGNLREAMRRALTRKESALLALYRLADSLMRLHAAIEADAALPLAQNRYYPATPENVDLAMVRQLYTRSDAFAAKLSGLDDSLVHLDHLVSVSMQVALSASPVLQVMNPSVEAEVGKLNLTDSVPNIVLDCTEKFVRVFVGFNMLESFKTGIVRNDPAPFLQPGLTADPSIIVREDFSHFPDKTLSYTFAPGKGIEPTKSWMQRKIQYGPDYDFFDFESHGDAEGTGGFSANVIVKFASLPDLTLVGHVQLHYQVGLVSNLNFFFNMTLSNYPADFDWSCYWPMSERKVVTTIAKLESQTAALQITGANDDAALAKSNTAGDTMPDVNKPLSPQELQLIQDACVAAGVKGVSVSDFRETQAYKDLLDKIVADRIKEMKAGGAV
ncbi:hypothetical protein BDR26DRAFT_854736 [Obelidium mucronatum]|nr:hypothetical protein BDR26DRAFT_854736 [Obelidium mucronatum]